MTIKVVAENHVRAEALETFLAAAKELVAETNAKDAGCIAYDIWRDVDDPLHLTMLEEWESQAALDAHSASEHFHRLVPVLHGDAISERPGSVVAYEAIN